LRQIKTLKTLLDELFKRINIEIFGGVVLEVVQKTIIELLQPMID